MQPATLPLTLLLMGDVMLGRYVDDAFTASTERKTAAFGDVLPWLHALDPSTTVIAGNLECAITSHKQRTPKSFNFKLSPQNADVLQQLRLGFVSTANNHVLDYGQPGLTETHKVLDRLGIAHAGSGTQPAASQPALVTTPAGHRVAFLAYSDHYEEWAASEAVPGINFIDPGSFDAQLLRQQVAAARAAGGLSDLVVVMIHWGPNWRWQPDKHLRELGRAFLGAGADLVFGTSPHHVQGVEFVASRPIIYSGGSFIDDYSTDEHFRNNLSAVYIATFAPPPASSAAAAAAAARPHSPVASPTTPTARVQTAAAATAAAAAAGDGGSSSSSRGDTCSSGGAGSGSRKKARVSAGHVVAVITPSPPSTPAAAAAATKGATSTTAAQVQSHTASQAAARGAQAQAEGLSSTAVKPPLMLQALTALPIAITHHWRSEGAPYAEEGGGNPPYFSQVDFATGDNWQWVANKLQQLSKALGHSDTVSVAQQQQMRVVPGSAGGSCPGVRLFDSKD